MQVVLEVRAKARKKLMSNLCLEGFSSTAGMYADTEAWVRLLSD